MNASAGRDTQDAATKKARRWSSGLFANHGCAVLFQKTAGNLCSLIAAVSAGTQRHHANATWLRGTAYLRGRAAGLNDCRRAAGLRGRCMTTRLRSTTGLRGRCTAWLRAAYGLAAGLWAARLRAAGLRAGAVPATTAKQLGFRRAGQHHQHGDRKYGDNQTSHRVLQKMVKESEWVSCRSSFHAPVSQSGVPRAMARLKATQKPGQALNVHSAGSDRHASVARPTDFRGFDDRRL